MLRSMAGAYFLVNEVWMKKRRNDLLLILCLLAAAGIGCLLLTLGRQTGSCAVVTADGKELARYPLDADGEYIIETARGVNTIVIEDGCARVTDADCPDRICVRTGSVQWDGQTIVCLPHRLVVRIEGGEEAQVDAVAR